MSFINHCSPKTQIGRLRLIGYIEGLSFIVLLGVAMPLKYFAGQPQYVRIVGLTHGLLFVLYVLGLIQAKIEYGWPMRVFGLGLLASIVPFGPFYADTKLYPPATPQLQEQPQ